VKARRTDSSRIERIPLVATTARPLVIFARRPPTEWTSNAGARSVKLLLLIKVWVQHGGCCGKVGGHGIHPSMISRQRHDQRNSDRKKWRRSKRGRGSSKTCVSPASNSNSFPHSSTGQPTRNFSLLGPSAVGCVRTTQVPHLGQVTHEHAMRSAIPQLYCAINERPSSTLALSMSCVGWQNFSPPCALWVGN